MDRSLDDAIQARMQSGRHQRDRRPPRDGIRKSYPRDGARNINNDWLHDRYDEESDSRRPRSNHIPKESRRAPELDITGAKLKVENLHYELTEDEIKELFNRIGPVKSVSLQYDRQDRSTGVAYVVYPDPRDAKRAVEEYNGANANGQPISLTEVHTKTRNPFDTAERPGRSLFDRVDQVEYRRRQRARDSSDEPPTRRSDVTKPAPDHIDRYIPGQEGNRSRRRSPRVDNGGGRGRDNGGRRPGQRRRGPPRDSDGHLMVGGRPRKTAEELDAEMADYWDGGSGENGNAGPQAMGDDDIDMDI